MLALVFRGTDGAAYGVVKTPQLAFGAGIHVAHAADYSVRLIVEVERIGDKLLEVDLGWAFGTSTVAAIAAAVVATIPASATTAATRTVATGATAIVAASFGTLLFLLRFCHKCLSISTRRRT
jgi:hypothetical protein